MGAVTELRNRDESYKDSIPPTVVGFLSWGIVKTNWPDSWKSLPIVNINDEQAKCSVCGAGLSGLSDFVYEKQTKDTGRVHDELCTCLTCHTQFILHYDLFDKDGHVYSRVFTGDINNPAYNWQDILTRDQKIAIADHLMVCEECTDRLSEEVLADAWFSSFLNDRAKKR